MRWDHVTSAFALGWACGSGFVALVLLLTRGC